MPSNLRSLAKDTAIYGLSSIVGRFLNYLLVPLYTHCMPSTSGDYGVSTNIYAYVALILVILTFGMETTLFRFASANASPSTATSSSSSSPPSPYQPDTVFSTAFALVATLSLAFCALVFAFIHPIGHALGYEAHPEYLLMMASVVAMDAMQAIPFSYLRYEKRPLRFAALKLLFIVLNISLNCIFFLALHKTEVYYIFLINLLSTGLISLLFIPMLMRIRWRMDWDLLRRMLAYSWPLLILGIAGILNQTADKMLFPLVYPDKQEAQVQLGIYGACVKIAMIMAMITQAFRYAYEPIVFARSREKGSREYQAQAMKYFIALTLLAYLCVIGYMPLLQHIIGAGYREGLRVVPIVMAAEIMMGVYFNLSFWYKLIDRTIYGALFSLVGCAVLVAVNLWGVPRWGYMACAWGGLAGYGTAMVLSYVVGQRKYPVPYPMHSIAVFVAWAVCVYGVMERVTVNLPVALRLAANTLLILAYTAHLAWEGKRK